VSDSNDKFLMLAYCGLVLRGYNRVADIDDPILKQVWLRGRKLAKVAGVGETKPRPTPRR
jgi:hypothetical protein